MLRALRAQGRPRQRCDLFTIAWDIAGHEQTHRFRVSDSDLPAHSIARPTQCRTTPPFRRRLAGGANTPARTRAWQGTSARRAGASAPCGTGVVILGDAGPKRPNCCSQDAGSGRRRAKRSAPLYPILSGLLRGRFSLDQAERGASPSKS